MQYHDVRSEKDPLGTFKILLISSRVLTDKEAEVYATIIDIGQATAADIHHRLKKKAQFENIVKQTVHGLLDELQEKGFIKSTLASGKRTHSTLYRANSPEDALSTYFSAIEQLKDTTDQVVALLEQKYEQQGNKVNDQNIWIYEPQKIALREGIKYLEGAKKSILMYCNNYSWIEEPGITTSLKKKMKESIDIRILGGPPTAALQNTIKKFNKVRKETSIPCTPYCIVDGEQLLIFLNDGFDPKLLATKNIYMVERHSAQFSKVWEEYSKEV